MSDLEQADLLRMKVNEAYSAVAATPAGKHPLPNGRNLAEDLGYPPELLDTLPRVSTDAFAGVSNVSLFAQLLPGAIILDLGCGAGMDSIIAARRIGPTGQVIGIDFSEAMLERARRARQSQNLPHLEFKAGDAEHLPLADTSVDAVLVNGIFNLNPKRQEIFAELARVLRPGGSAWVAELILAKPLPESDRANPDNWFA
jgi:arsenite methyltransferase